jgi:tRNA wybutosine-synthesizing protein 4
VFESLFFIFLHPALWFHNVVALEPCVSINVFWKHLPDGFYDLKDLYGNKDLPTGVAAVQAATKAAASLSQVTCATRTCEQIN